MTWTLVGGLISLAVTAWAGHLLGRAVKSRASAYFWAANIAVFAAAVALIVVSTSQVGVLGELLWGVGLGLGFGGIAGLRTGRRGGLVAQPGARR